MKSSVLIGSSSWFRGSGINGTTSESKHCLQSKERKTAKSNFSKHLLYNSSKTNAAQAELVKLFLQSTLFTRQLNDSLVKGGRDWVVWRKPFTQLLLSLTLFLSLTLSLSLSRSRQADHSRMQHADQSELLAPTLQNLPFALHLAPPRTCP